MSAKRKIHVAVISKDWQLRALVRAQLLEQGFEAVGLESVADAIELLTWNRMRADILLIDPDDQNLDEAVVAEVRRLLPRARVIALLRPTVSNRSATRLLRPEKVIVRPFAVRDVVDLVRRVAAELPPQ